MSILDWLFRKREPAATMEDFYRIQAECRLRGEEEDYLFREWNAAHGSNPRYTEMQKMSLMSGSSETMMVSMLNKDGWAAFDDFYQTHRIYK